MRGPDGELRKGGVWFGGQSYFMCSRKAVEIASRPQNVPGVCKRFAPDVYFADTMFAANPYECFAPEHPLSRGDDMRYKGQLADYIREQAGLFGSEEGAEWGVPHADYFEGILSHKTGYQRLNDAQWLTADIIVPLFELVYGDAIPMYTHQSDRPQPDNPGYILTHILYAEMPVYNIGDHDYWKEPGRQDYKPDMLVFARGPLNPTDQFIKNTYEILSPLNRLTALLPMTDHRFLTADRKVESTTFGDSVHITVNYGATPYNTGTAELPRWGFMVESPKWSACYATSYRGQKFGEAQLRVMNQPR
jgi:hypothetical protein